MLAYFLVFLISFVFAYIAEKHEKRKMVFIIFSACAILLPSFLAGFRQSGVGTDTTVYIDSIFRYCANTNSLSSVLNVIQDSGTEPLYWLINYVVSRFSRNLSTIYFVLEFIFVFFSYLGCRKISKKLNIKYSFCYLILMLLFFNKSLNMCRQSLAMSICLFSLPYILDKKMIKFLMCMFLAFLFHKSAILFIPLYFINCIVMSKNKISILPKIGVILAVVLIVFLYKYAIVGLVDLNLLDSKYLNYVYRYGDDSNIKAIEIIFQTTLLFIGLLFSKSFIKRSQYNNFFVYLSVLAFSTFLIGYNARYAQRISYYYSFCLVFLIGQLPYFVQKAKEKILVFAFIITALMVYGQLYYGKYDFDHTCPYRMEINKNI